MDREPRLPMEPPPPARAQASAWKAQAHRNNRAKRVNTPFVQIFNFIDLLRDKVRLKASTSLLIIIISVPPTSGTIIRRPGFGAPVPEAGK
jgi:hypothetical protein